MERTLFEPEHELFRESYRKFLAQQCEPNHAKWEEQNIVDREPLGRGRQAGFPRHGGAGGVRRRRRARLPLQRDHHRGDPPAVGYSGIGFTLHNDVVAPYLLELANEEQKQRWLPGFASR